MKDLSSSETTYTYYLYNNRSKLESLFSDSKVSLTQFKLEVLDMCTPANDTNAKRNFESIVKRSTNKTSLFEYLYNIILSGSNLKVIR